MRILTIEQEHISPFIESGQVIKIESKLCNEFNDYISTNYPWHGVTKDRIDWDKIGGYKRLEWIKASDIEAKDFIRKTCLGKFQKLGIVYSALQPGIVSDFDTIIDNLELLSAHTPWILFIVGASVDNYGIYKFHHESFIELWRFEQFMTAPS